jgi:hypothetical protein
MGTTAEKPIVGREKLSGDERDQLIIRYAPWVKFIALRMARSFPPIFKPRILLAPALLD